MHKQAVPATACPVTTSMPRRSHSGWYEASAARALAPSFTLFMHSSCKKEDVPFENAGRLTDSTPTQLLNSCTVVGAW